MENIEQEKQLDSEQIEAQKAIEFLKMTIDEKLNAMGDDAHRDIVRLKLVIYDLKQFWDV